ncbi:DNA phosphorothioation-dependent restriction protein DptG [Staphylococcus sp. HMSC072B07]|uniref:DNA phosphorothioation-dependent restriction protein DptG n=2 Tax=Staphylococcus TaxID=1279 RepID=UPI0002992B44|nr:MULTISPECIES: DNA phosphorothioation-dependent restriction protein DptG [Staphylococcus]EKS26927.1 DNA phosphorothioation-dependent restriction protein DptG [Staphylococcus simulans ACS-120-V-Sch1]MBO0386902.1 DNA phosphorothioation-dependent restriction protein DptG [Staphylococcus simulans]MDK8176102.1 DNA phosphorothioation-dependent restriction protein DptG [Staphylococcus simulans]MDQ7114317.1 DNA phosphorothioation-dependent restriction protein DptG [Staphylococcus simulans]MDQ7140017
MADLSTQLINKLKLSNDKPNFKRNFKNKLLPFFTRNPERAKFSQGFEPVIGALSRMSIGWDPVYLTDNYNIDNIVENVDSVQLLDGFEMGEDEKHKFLSNLFNESSIKSFRHPFLLNYYTLSENNEKKGEVDVAKFIMKIFDLSNDENWKKFISDRSTSNLVEDILIESLEKIPQQKTDNQFVLINKEIFRERFEDLSFLLEHKDFAIKNLSLFFSFYYFQFLMQTVLTIDRFNVDDSKLFELYYTLDSEKITSTRITNKRGFNLIKSIYKNILANDNLIGYLNELLEYETFYSLQDIKNMDNSDRQKLDDELKTVLEMYKTSMSKQEFIPEDLDDKILMFRDWLVNDVSNETISRFPKSIEEIGDLYFLKRRGQLGKVLTLRKELIILLTALIVKSEKMIVTEVFNEFEKRGVFLDRYSKEEIVELYEKMNILDKKSDSGEAKYVKPIL